jgi:hypothetical protein
MKTAPIASRAVKLQTPQVKRPRVGVVLSHFIDTLWFFCVRTEAKILSDHVCEYHRQRKASQGNHPSRRQLFIEKYMALIPFDPNLKDSICLADQKTCYECGYDLSVLSEDDLLGLIGRQQDPNWPAD